jgi:hypothetical protein
MRVTRTVGSLADELVEAEQRLLDARALLEDLLDSLYGDQGWASYEVGPMACLDVYGVTASPAAADALRRAGWDYVWQHDHAATSFLGCACRAAR